MAYIPFDEVKERFSIDDVAQLLGLAMKKSGEQLRGECPKCGSGGPRALVITPAKQVYFCWSEKKGGDLIGLVSHIHGCDAKEAAAWLMRDSDNSSRDTSPKGTVPSTKQEQGFSPLEYLESDHEAVGAVGFSIEIAKQLGIGYAPKGVLRGTVAIPCRDEHGTLLGYIGITEATLPVSFRPTNVVPLKRA